MDPSQNPEIPKRVASSTGKRKIANYPDKQSVVSSKKQKVVVNVESGVYEDVTVNVGNSDPISKKKCSTYMSPRKLVSLLKSLNEEQQQSVKDLGFGFLFDLKICIVQSPLLNWLVYNFDYEACCFHINGHRIPVEPFDVHLVFGLQLGGIPVHSIKRKAAPLVDKTFSDILSLCISDVGDDLSWPTLRAIRDALHLHPGSSDSFKRLFILYFVNTFLDGPTRVGVATKTFLYNLVDISSIPRLDWCSYFIHRVVESVKAIKSGEHYFTGPIVFLVLFYLDRVKYEAIPHLRHFPIVNCWCEEDFKSRYKRELIGNGFGRGSVLPRISSPRCLEPDSGRFIPKPDFLAEYRNKPDTSHISDDLQCHLELIMEYSKKLSVLASNISAEVVYIRNNFKDYLHVPRVSNALKSATSHFTSTSNALKDEILDTSPIADLIVAKNLLSLGISPILSPPKVHAVSNYGLDDIADINEEVPDSPVCVPRADQNANTEPLVTKQICDRGHTLCSSCCTKLKSCPTCRLRFANDRCLAIEKVIESVTVSCGYLKYGCKEMVMYCKKHEHEEICIYAPCSCPYCKFQGSPISLSQHIVMEHKDFVVLFRYDSSFPVFVGMDEKAVLQEEKDGMLFILSHGMTVNIMSIDLSPSKPRFAYDIALRQGDNSLNFQSLTRCIEGQVRNRPVDYFVVPSFFHSSNGRLKLDVCIRSKSCSKVGLLVSN